MFFISISSDSFSNSALLLNYIASLYKLIKGIILLLVILKETPSEPERKDHLFSSFHVNQILPVGYSG